MNKNLSELDVMKAAAAKVTGIVTGNRNQCYGTPSENHQCTGDMWTDYLTRRFQSEGLPVYSRRRMLA